MAAVAPPRKSDMKYGGERFDEEYYRTSILRLSMLATEDDIDEKLARDAQELGLVLAPASGDADGMASSLSTTTLSSEPHTQSSIISRSTARTSCSPSDRRPPPSDTNDPSPPPSTAPSILSEVDQKRHSGFRQGIRRMVGFHKRRSLALSSSTVTSLGSEIASSPSNEMSSTSGVKRPRSVKSSEGSWSSPPSALQLSYGQPALPDHEAVKRSMNCKGMWDLRMRQLEERARFLDYQRTILEQLRSQYQGRKQQTIAVQEKMIARQTEKNERAVEDLETRQLEEEIKLVKEFEVEKRAVMIRLRHMEAYCRSPTPPPTPVHPASGRPPVDLAFRDRKVTERDYHNLARQYRERDTLDDLHASKINVLRGKQKRAVETFMIKRERETEIIEHRHGQEIDQIDRDAATEEHEVTATFDAKRSRLETRWRIQALVERRKIENLTGLPYAPLPDILAVDDPTAR